MIAPLRRYGILGFMLLSSCLSLAANNNPPTQKPGGGPSFPWLRKLVCRSTTQGGERSPVHPPPARGGVIILNPENGPIPNDGSFNNDLLAAYSAGIKIFGYIDTVGKPDSGTVNQEINDYYAWYNTIGSTTGIIVRHIFRRRPRGRQHRLQLLHDPLRRR